MQWKLLPIHIILPPPSPEGCTVPISVYHSHACPYFIQSFTILYKVNQLYAPTTCFFVVQCQVSEVYPCWRKWKNTGRYSWKSKILILWEWSTGIGTTQGNSGIIVSHFTLRGHIESLALLTPLCLSLPPSLQCRYIKCMCAQGDLCIIWYLRLQSKSQGLYYVSQHYLIENVILNALAATLLKVKRTGNFNNIYKPNICKTLSFWYVISIKIISETVHVFYTKYPTSDVYFTVTVCVDFALATLQELCSHKCLVATMLHSTDVPLKSDLKIHTE